MRIVQWMIQRKMDIPLCSDRLGPCWLGRGHRFFCAPFSPTFSQTTSSRSFPISVVGDTILALSKIFQNRGGSFFPNFSNLSKDRPTIRILHRSFNLERSTSAVLLLLNHTNSSMRTTRVADEQDTLHVIDATDSPRDEFPRVVISDLASPISLPPAPTTA